MTEVERMSLEDEIPAGVDPDDPEGLKANPVEAPELSGLAAVEAEHGFTFGGGPAPAGSPVAVVSCVNPTCAHRSQLVQVFEGHPDPVHCGGCFAVLHCVHVFEDRVRHEGTVGAPVEVRESACTKCDTVGSASRRSIVVSLNDLPVSALTALLNG